MFYAETHHHESPSWSTSTRKNCRMSNFATMTFAVTFHSWSITLETLWRVQTTLFTGKWKTLGLHSLPSIFIYKHLLFKWRCEFLIKMKLQISSGRVQRSERLQRSQSQKCRSNALLDNLVSERCGGELWKAIRGVTEDLLSADLHEGLDQGQFLKHKHNSQRTQQLDHQHRAYRSKCFLWD